MRLLAIITLLLPLTAWAGEDIRIVKCTQGLYAVQEMVLMFLDEEWRPLRHAPGCYPLEYALMIKQDEIDGRNRPPAPYVIEPVQVVE